MHDIWNPWHGCVRVSSGCANCYMYSLAPYLCSGAIEQVICGSRRICNGCSHCGKCR